MKHGKVSIFADVNCMAEFQLQARLWVENQVVGYSSIYKQASVELKGLVISFGGTNGYSTTNQVVAYRPGGTAAFANKLQFCFVGICMFMKGILLIALAICLDKQEMHYCQTYVWAVYV